MKISPTKNGQKDSKIYSSTIHKISNMYDPNLIKISDNPFPKIFLTKKLANNYPLFLKCYTFEEKFLLEAFQAEIQKTLQCTSKAYNDIIDFFIANEKNSYELYLFLERADFSLNELILSISENIPKPEPEILQIYSDLAYNLQLAHKNNFIHGNIHPQNILVFCNCRERPIEAQKFNVFTSNIYKLTDWMFDCVLQNQNMSNLKHLNQNTAFRAPEFFNFSKHELNYKACDVYSLGMSILHCCGVPLKKLLPIAISDNEIHDIQLSKIFQGILQTYDLKLCNILKMSLDYDPKERWNIDDVVEALKHLSKDSKIVQDLSNDLINGKKPKKGILKKLFSGMFGAKKNKPTLKDKGPEIQIIGPNNESLNEYFFNTKTSSLQVYSKEDYSLIFTQKHSKNSKYIIEKKKKNYFL